jgi:hypothetical protein
MAQFLEIAASEVNSWNQLQLRWKLKEDVVAKSLELPRLFSIAMSTRLKDGGLKTALDAVEKIGVRVMIYCTRRRTDTYLPR